MLSVSAVLDFLAADFGVAAAGLESDRGAGHWRLLGVAVGVRGALVAATKSTSGCD